MRHSAKPHRRYREADPLQLLPSAASVLERWETPSCGEAQIVSLRGSSSNDGTQALGTRCICSLEQPSPLSLMSPFLSVPLLLHFIPQLPFLPACSYCHAENRLPSVGSSCASRVCVWLGLISVWGCCAWQVRGGVEGTALCHKKGLFP